MCANAAFDLSQISHISETRYLILILYLSISFVKVSSSLLILYLEKTNMLCDFPVHITRYKEDTKIVALLFL